MKALSPAGRLCLALGFGAGPSSVFHRMAEIEGSARALSSGLPRIEPAQWISTLPSGGVVVWIAIGVAVILTGFVFTRVIEEI